MPTIHHHHHHHLLLLLVPLGLLASLRLAAPIISLAPSPSSTADANATAHDLLTLLGLPAGLLPGNVVAYTLSDDGEFMVELSEPCYVWFRDLAYYDKTIRGRITYGRISGIQVRKFFIWVDITSVAASKKDGGGSIVFTSWIVSETRPASEFLEVRPCEKTAGAHSSSSSSSSSSHLQSGVSEGVAAE